MRLVGVALGVFVIAVLGAIFWFLFLYDPYAGRDLSDAPSSDVPSVSTPGSSAPESSTADAEPQPPAEPPASSPATPSPTAQTDTERPTPEERQAAARPAVPSQARESGEAEQEAVPETERGNGGPSFDVVRVERDGSSVMAGRASPDSEVVVRKDGEELARGRADSRGEFVLLPERALPPGDYALELEATTPQGETRSGRNVVVLSVPEGAPAASETTANGGSGDVAADVAGDPAGEVAQGEVSGAPDAPRQGPLVVQLPTEGAGEPRVMQLPEPAPAQAAGGLWLEAIDYDADGRLVITGQGLPGERLLAYLDNSPLGEAEADGEGRWRLLPQQEVAPGLYTLRVDQVNREGAVTARVESPFARAAFETADLPADERFVVIQPGNNLWTIARRTYGLGPRYTVIFDANADQIRDPDLIYPGQIFVLPDVETSG
ncbi:MAG: LysM peptidoglycan-binding domain-containing protein [Kiloniellales bacterium]